MSDAITVTGEIRRFWREQIGDEPDGVKVPEIAALGVAAFQADPNFCARFAEEYLYTAIYDIGIALVGVLRRSAARETVSIPAELLAEQIAEGVPEGVLKSSIRKSLEYDPAERIHVPILQMSYEQISRAIANREDQAGAQLKRAAYLREIHKRMAPGQNVGDVWNEEELAALEVSIIMERAKPRYRVKRSPVLDHLREITDTAAD